MFRYKALFVTVIISTLFIATAVFAQNEKPAKLNDMLSELTRSRITTLQKANIIESYKGQIMGGSARVKDVIDDYATQDKANIYLIKPYRGVKYKLTLLVDKDTAKELKKGRRVNFEGRLVEMTFNTLHFKNAKIIKRSFWSF